jgi:glycerol uptake facilitator-like aquaporin
LAAQRSFAATEDEAGKLACFSTGPAIRNYTSNLISEIIGTFSYFCDFLPWDQMYTLQLRLTPK